LAYHACPALPEDHIRRKACRIFTDSLGYTYIKYHLLLGDEEMVSEALSRPEIFRSLCYPSYQTPVNEHQDILEEQPPTPNEQVTDTTCMPMLQEAQPLLRKLPLQN
jgi:hypothetical protein